jgi:hypothetical protein
VDAVPPETWNAVIICFSQRNAFNDQQNHELYDNIIGRRTAGKKHKW